MLLTFRHVISSAAEAVGASSPPTGRRVSHATREKEPGAQGVAAEGSMRALTARLWGKDEPLRQFAHILHFKDLRATKSRGRAENYVSRMHGTLYSREKH